MSPNSYTPMYKECGLRRRVPRRESELLFSSKASQARLTGIIVVYAKNPPPAMK